MIRSVHPNPVLEKPTAPLSQPAAAMREDIARSVSRGRVINAIQQGILVFSALLVGLLIFACLDAIFVINVWLRIALLLGLLLTTCVVGGWIVIRHFFVGQYTFGTAERIDSVSQQDDQPVIRGMSLMPMEEEDRLTSILQERAEQRAADLTSITPSRRVYPLRSVGKPAGVLFDAFLLWGLLAVLFPAQFGGLLSRVLIPFGGAAPFSLTQLDPTWTPDPPTEGDDVTVSVQPGGREPEAVDFVRVDEAGRELERFAMTAGVDGGFSHRLVSVDEPIHFHLETRGRPSRDYTIKPLPKPTPPQPSGSDEGDSGNDSSTSSDTQDSGGTTSYDPAAAGEVVRNAHEDWPELRERIEALMRQLTDVEAKALAIDPADLQSIADLEGELAAITADAEALAADLQALQTDLPPDAAATLAGLLATLEQFQSASLGTCPNPGSGTSDQEGSPEAAGNQPATPQQWLDRVGESAGADTKQLANGLGNSSVPTESGTTSGRPDGITPAFIDPAAAGTADEQGVTADTGPLPPAVMQQVPPSYRDHIRAYFTELAESEEQP